MAGSARERGRRVKEIDGPSPSSAPGNLVSPPGSKTPPSNRMKSNVSNGNLEVPRQRIRPGSEPVNADALSRALKGYDDLTRQHRERTPGTSPSRKRQRIYGDRYVIYAWWNSCVGLRLQICREK